MNPNFIKQQFTFPLKKKKWEQKAHCERHKFVTLSGKGTGFLYLKLPLPILQPAGQQQRPYSLPPLLVPLMDRFLALQMEIKTFIRGFLYSARHQKPFHFTLPPSPHHHHWGTFIKRLSSARTRMNLGSSKFPTGSGGS